MEWTSVLAFDRRLAVRLILLISLFAASLALVQPAPANAGISHGDMVDYDMVFPVDGDARLRDSFGDCRSGCSYGHEGQDLFARKRTRVLATNSGTIKYVNWSTSPGLNPSRCCSIVINHDDGWQSRYLHLNNDERGTDNGKGWGVADGIAPGVHVKAGQLIGWVGDSGNAEDTPAHLHYELRTDDRTLVNSYDSLVAAQTKASEPDDKGDGDPLFDSNKTLRKGDRGAGVERLQKVLNKLGYDAGPADGIFGKGTEKAVKAFQESVDLKEDGIVGKKTKAELEKQFRPMPTLRKGDRSDDVAYLQELLNDNGFDAGPADGIFGKGTETAVKAFQKSAGLKTDGIVGKKTWTALRSA